MRRKQDRTRERIIDSAYEQFWRHGFARTSLDTIAVRAKLTKRTLYGYFRSKDDLLAAVLTHYAALAKERLGRIEAQMPADAEGMIDSFFAQLASWASRTPRWSGSGLTRLVVELADLPGHPARQIAHKAKATTELWLASRLKEARIGRPDERARQILLLVEGAMALTLIHGGTAYIDAARNTARHLVAGSAHTRRRRTSA
jgi:AcrR family transcriptional regulator